MRSAFTRVCTSLTSCAQITDGRSGVTGTCRGMHSVCRVGVKAYLGTSHVSAVDMITREPVLSE